MEKIWKYELNLIDNQEILTCKDHEILSCQIQNNKPCLWVKVNPDSDRTHIIPIDIIGTGNPMPDFNREFIDTIQLEDGALVFHVFKRLED